MFCTFITINYMCMHMVDSPHNFRFLSTFFLFSVSVKVKIFAPLLCVLVLPEMAVPEMTIGYVKPYSLTHSLLN